MVTTERRKSTNVRPASLTIPSLHFKKTDDAKLGKGWGKVRRNLAMTVWRLAIWSPVCLVKQSLIVFNKVRELCLASCPPCPLPAEMVFYFLMKQ